MRILLVEDNADHRELMHLALTGHDATWQVEGVVSGEEALRHLAEGEAYDLVFLDYSLPRPDGLEVLAEIRRGAAPPPVVMVTGRGDEQVAVKAMKGGAYDYVVKGEGYLQRLPVVAQRAVEAHQLAVERKRAEEALRRLHEEAEQRGQEAETFATLLRDLASSLELDEVLTHVVAKAKDLSEGDLAFLALVEADGKTLTIRTQTGAASTRLVGLTLTRGQGLDGKVLETGEILTTADYLGDSRFSHEYDVIAHTEGILVQAAVPVLHEGASLGVLLVARRTARPFTPADLQVLARLADAASLACHHALVYRQAANRAVVLERLWWGSQVLSRSLTLSVTLDRIVQTAQDLLRSDYARLALWDAATQCLTHATQAGGEALSIRQVCHPDEGMSGTVAKTRFPLILNDYQAFPPQLPEAARITAGMAVPLLVEDRLIGTLSVGSTELGRSFATEDLHLLELLAQPAAVAIENARLFEEVQVSRKRLQALSRRQLDLQENERRSLARELHDEIGQLLTGLKLVLEMAAVAAPEISQDSLRESQALVGELIGRVRELSLNLRPSILDDLGLLPALFWQFERYTAQTKIQVNFEHAGLEGRRCASEVETAAYRIVQESLTNVVRHAQVDAVQVKVGIEGCMLLVRIEDHGCGFESTLTLVPDASSGLAGMRERATLLGGRMRIESSPGAGTLILAELPLDLSPDNSRRS